MVFSSLEFVFVFLPIAFLGDRILQKNILFRNAFLLMMSIVFYAWGEGLLVLLFIGTILLNWLAALLVESKGKWIGIIAIVIDIGILFLFKYYNWFATGIKEFGIVPFPVVRIGLPIGISFYTFQAISYVVDIILGKVRAQKNPVSVGLYIAFFPQLIAGPIVRYTDIEDQLNERKTTIESFSEGTIRFLLGFSKKILLADSMGIVADKAFNLLQEGRLGMLFAWLGALCYTLQIFMDFSAYSDMAIGLGQVFGFKIPENFNMPYQARTIRDFWRRWHISLSIWFRDYVYIPLGGNRGTAVRTYINIAIVWFLTGLWHGANLTFVIWGACYGILVMAEKAFHIDEIIIKKNRYISAGYRLFTFLCVMILWVVFRADSIDVAITYLCEMVSIKDISTCTSGFVMYFSEMKVEIITCLLLSFISIPKKITDSGIYKGIKSVGAFVLFFISLSYLVKGNYSPFLYFNF